MMRQPTWGTAKRSGAVPHAGCTRLLVVLRSLLFPSDAEFLRVDPFQAQQRPEVESQLVYNVVIRQPSISFVSPGRAPRVANKQRPSGRLVALCVLIHIGLNPITDSTPT